ncbi:helix-turn-helix domain-containing protein [Niastella sp. OAS944]|uniref:helix-turn-helix domain-containing protein n=1 Tax=Niastella sp. OAS944 TaxID=2664089 RepID=UPI003485984D|nr:AraC-like DNA-binding protein [Chitinophagaceae bacterium OAS944]
MLKSLRLKEDDRNALQSIHDKIACDPTANHTLADLAYEAGINTKKLTYGFKQLFGITVYEYMVNLRMKYSESLLFFTEKDVQTIARLSGYKTKASFTLAFKKKNGIAPYKWRQKNSLMAI